MAIGTITILKLNQNNENNSIGYYEISSQDFKMNNFYMRINKSIQILTFFQQKHSQMIQFG